MKPEKLMIGDWLNTSRGIAKVIAVDKIGLTFKIDGGDFDIDWDDEEEWFDAIPLTSEILEKNGFDISDPEVKQYYFEEDGQRYHFSLRQMYNQKDGKPNGYSFFAFGVLTIIDYVHELQHALRLCGIEKEIML